MGCGVSKNQLNSKTTDLSSVVAVRNDEVFEAQPIPYDSNDSFLQEEETFGVVFSPTPDESSDFRSRGQLPGRLQNTIRREMHTIYEDSGPSNRVDTGSDIVTLPPRPTNQRGVHHYNRKKILRGPSKQIDQQACEPLTSRPSRIFKEPDDVPPPVSTLLLSSEPQEPASTLPPPNLADVTRPGIFHDYYTLEQRLTEGSYSEVHVCIDIETQKKWTVKHILNRSAMIWNGRDALVDDLVALQTLRQAPSVVYLKEYFMGDTECFVVMELLPGKCLSDHLIEHGTLNEIEAQDVCKCVLEGLKYMHSLRVAHRGLKPENIMLVEANRHSPVKISDFGYSKTLSRRNECRTLCGTIGYMAPEVLELYPAYDVEVDIWSLGVVLFVVLGGYLPFQSQGENTVKQIFDRTRNGEYSFPAERWYEISQPGKEMVGRCLTVYPDRRISAEDALDHYWFKTSIKKASNFQISSIDLAGSVDTGHGTKSNDRAQILQELKDVVSDYHMRSPFVVHAKSNGSVDISSSSSSSPDDSTTGQPFSDFYALGEELGKGSYGTVHRCIHNHTKLTYAVKEVDYSKVKHRKAMKTLKEEVKVLKLLRGAPNIIFLYDVFREPNKTYMILEEMKGGNLMSRIRSRVGYTEREARQLCKALFQAVDFCHSCRIVHRDIKPDNLLLQEKGNDASLKLADFGFSKIMPDPEGRGLLRTMCGTPHFMAPEVYRAHEKGYDHRCDMWSVGVVVYLLIGGAFPFDVKLMKEKRLPEKVYFDPKIWSERSSSVKKLIVGLLEQDVDQRLSAKMALESRWILTEDDGKLSTLDLSATQSRLTENVLSDIPGVIFIDTEADFLQQTRNQEAIPAEVSTNASASTGTTGTDFVLEFKDVYTMSEEIGVGFFSKIQAAIEISSGREFSVKKVVRRDLLPGEYACLNNEIKVLNSLKKARGDEIVAGTMVQLHEMYQEPEVTYLVFQKLRGEVLLERLNRQTKFAEYEAKELIGSLLLGVKHCHSKRIAIRNLTVDNLLLPQGLLRIIITDFEVAKRAKFKNTLRTQCGTLEFVAPEVLQSNLAYDVICDMWSVGVILYMMLSGSHPFHVDASTHSQGRALDGMLRKIRYGDYRFPREQGWNNVSMNAKNLLQQMLTVNPDERVSAVVALSHDWFVGVSY